jgi:hypothetical protein
MMVQQAGFDRIRVEGGYAHADATRDSDVLVFIAHKPHDRLCRPAASTVFGRHRPPRNSR